MNMQIDILHLIEGARQARGLVVIIDVFRAFSTACYFFHNGAEKIITVGDIEVAYKLKKDHPEYLLVGERNESKPPGFDYGNSPTHIRNIDFTGKTIIQTTSSGTQGIVNAESADEMLTGSFINAGAVIRYIRAQKLERISLVCMGYAAERKTEEDTFCAEYIYNELHSLNNDFRRMKRIIRRTSGLRFFKPENKEFSPPSDLDLCLNLNKFNFVLKAEKHNNHLYYLRQVNV